MDESLPIEPPYVPTSYSPDSELVEGLKSWLGEDGLKFFRGLLTRFGHLSPVITDHGYPHCVHFREGMAVRNQLRHLTKFSWSDHEYDDRWEAVVLAAISD